MAPRVHTGSDVVPQQEGVSLESDADHREQKLTRKSKQVLIVQSFCVFIISLDMTILTTTLPTVAQALEATATQSYWIAASYLLANAVCQPTMAALADALGRRSMFLGSIALFTIGSIICAAGPDVPAMLAGRTIQGIGGGGITSVNLIILSDLVPLRQRGRYLGLIQVPFGLGTNIAPVIGAALVKTDWRWIFYINLPFCAIGLVAVYFLLRYKEKEATMTARLASVDWLGSGFMIVSLTSFLVGMSWGGNSFPWRSAAVLVPVVLGSVGLVLTVLYEKHIAKDEAKNPFLRLGVFEHWSGVVISITTMLQGYTLFAMTYYLMIYLMACKLYSPMITAAWFLSFGAAVIPVSAVMGPLITHLGRYRVFIWSGWALITLGLGLIAVLDVDTSPVVWVFIFLCAGAGQGILFNGQAIALQASCSGKNAAYAASFYAFARGLGLCLAVIIGGTIFQNSLRIYLDRHGLPTEIATNFEGFIPILQGLSSEMPLKLEIQQAYAWALKILFGTSAGIGFVGLLLSLTVRHFTLDTEHVIDHALED